MYTQSEQTTEKEGGKTSSFRVRGCILSVIQAGFPFVEKGGGAGGQERRDRGGEEKTKQRVRDWRGRNESSKHVSVRTAAEPWCTVDE